MLMPLTLFPHAMRNDKLTKTLTACLWIALCAVQTACAPAVVKEIGTDLALSEFVSTLWVEDSRLGEKQWHADQIVPYFSFIPGSIFGSPTDDVFLPIEVDDKLQIVVQLADWEALAETYSRPLTQENLELGLRADPDDARILRVGTFAFDLLHSSAMGGALREIGSTGYVILVYVDRPCLISGSIKLHGETYTHRIDFPAKGFHYVNSGDDNHLTRMESQDHLLFITHH